MELYRRKTVNGPASLKCKGPTYVIHSHSVCKSKMGICEDLGSAARGVSDCSGDSVHLYFVVDGSPSPP